MLRYLSLALVLLSLSFCNSADQADLIIHNGNILTVDENNQTVSAMAVKDGQILAVGDGSVLEEYKGFFTEIVDLEGKTVIPGIIEGHAHFLGMGDTKMILDLTKAKTWDEIVELVAEAAANAPEGTWIRGRGFHQDKWDEKPDRMAEGYPTHDELSRVSPQNPVILTHASGHADIVNQLAMRLGGVTEATPDPENGRLLRTPDGLPAGVFQGSARNMIWSAYEDWRQTLSEEERMNYEVRAATLAAEECLRKGVTSFQDAGSSFQDVELFKRLADDNNLPVRLYVMIRQPLDTLKKYFPSHRTHRYGGNRLTVEAVKLSLDGALGARSAWMIEPYSDEPVSGINYFSLEEFEHVARFSYENNLQMCTHAIGDRANRETLNIYEKLFEEYGDADDRRWRVEHAQHLHPNDIPRFAELDVIASFQAVHCISDGPWVPTRIGKKRADEGAYRWRDFLDTGARIVNGTDAPVEDVDPIPNYHATITRIMNNGEKFTPEQALDRIEALRSITIDAAYAAFEEDIKGSLEPGKLADFVVLSDDIVRVAENEIMDLKVLSTWVGGEKLYQAE